MKDNKEYMKDVYNKIEQEKNNISEFYKTNIGTSKRPKMFNMVASLLLATVILTTGTFAGIEIYKGITVTPAFQQDVNSNTNVLWCGTFQLIWNDLMDIYTKGEPVEFIGYESALANELNKRSFTSDMLSSDSYYKVYGLQTLALKEQIEKDLKEKFNENSRILDNFSWNNEDYLLYCMLKKEFNFLKPFDQLEKDYFANSDMIVKYFGINENSSKELYDNVEVLWYNNNKDFAVKLFTKENEEVILYRTNEDKSLDALYSDVSIKSNNYTENKKFLKSDTLKVPYMEVDKVLSYDDICGHQIKGTDYLIEKAIQTIKFNLDNKGGKLVSEAAMQVDCTALLPEEVMPRHFDFTDEYVIFLKEASKEKPYFASKVIDNEMLVK
ncbi:MAG: hypothetical protein PHH22_01860 [Clostridia bacterium]|nr:hypothetical protein [Clostridia bacterium]